MSVDFGDPRNGFRHTEVIKFINEEVLVNGGSQDFHVTFNSWSWDEIEDNLRSVVIDPEVPLATKRAYALSALALSVPVAVRQREQQAYGAWRLQEQMEQCEATSSALSFELQRQREEHEAVVSQLRFAQAALHQALNERDALRGRLLQPQLLQRQLAQPPQPQPQLPQLQLPQEVLAILPAEHRGVGGWPLAAEEGKEALATRLQGGQHAEAQRGEAQMASLTGVSRSSSPWAQVVQPSLPMSFFIRFPCSTPSPPRIVRKGKAERGTSVPPQMPTGRYSPGIQPATVGSQEEIVHGWDQRSQSHEKGAVRTHFSNPYGNKKAQESNLNDTCPDYQEERNLLNSMKKRNSPKTSRGETEANSFFLPVGLL